MPALANILFLDVETVPLYPGYEELDGDTLKLWDTKASTLSKYHDGASPQELYPRAGIYAEFGKIVCISCGFIQDSGHEKKIALKSFYGHDEKLLLTEFTTMLNRWSADGDKLLCAHNGKEFDFPYICRRLVIHYLPIPGILNSSGKKPWEIAHLDTMEMWKFGDFKSFTSLNLLAYTLGIPTPKDDIDGSRVWEVYWKEKDLERIVTYCQKDVLTTAQVYLRIQGDTIIRSENVLIKNT